MKRSPDYKFIPLSPDKFNINQLFCLNTKWQDDYISDFFVGKYYEN